VCALLVVTGPGLPPDDGECIEGHDRLSLPSLGSSA
jgi:hypothetical protein